MLELKNLSLSYGDNRILNNISLKVMDGQCILLTGESGSGDNAIMMIVQ